MEVEYEVVNVCYLHALSFVTPLPVSRDAEAFCCARDSLLINQKYELVRVNCAPFRLPNFVKDSVREAEPF